MKSRRGEIFGTYSHTYSTLGAYSQASQTCIVGAPPTPPTPPPQRPASARPPPSRAKTVPYTEVSVHNLPRRDMLVRARDGRPMAGRTGRYRRVHKARARAARGGCRGLARRGHSGGKACRWRPRRTRRPESTPRSRRPRRVLQIAQNAQNQQGCGQSGQARSLLGRAGANGQRELVRDEMLRNHIVALRGVRRHLREGSVRNDPEKGLRSAKRTESGRAGRAFMRVDQMLPGLCG